VAVTTLAAMCALPLAAQQQRKPSPGPRALGLLVMPKAPAGAKKPPQPYLIPIALWFQNRYFDAQLYGARPEPMALDGGVVYEARRGGEALGLFTVDSVAQQENKKWLGGGQYQTMKEIESRAAARKARNVGPTTTEKDEGPPRLRRSGDKPAAPAPASTSVPPAATPTASAPAPGPSTPAGPAAPPATAAPAPQAKAPAEPDDEDPDRPRLHRAPTGEPQAIAPAIKPAPATSAPTSKNSPAAAAAAPANAPMAMAPMPEVMVAVSDAKTTEPRPYDFTWSPAEKTTYTKAAEQMANAAITDFLSRRYHVQPASPAPRAATSPRSRSRAATPPPAAPEQPLENEQVRALDVQTDNYPELVLMAQRTVQVPGAEGTNDTRTVYVTIVVRIDTAAVDRRDQFRTLLSYVTDDRHLDDTPRLTLIDAVDADGDGIGKLLFREVFSPADETNPQAWGFQLFRVGIDRLERLYDSDGKIE
jgi:hypothetical protein